MRTGWALGRRSSLMIGTVAILIAVGAAAYAQGEPSGASGASGGQGIAGGLLPSYESEAPGGVSRAPHLQTAATAGTTATAPPNAAGGAELPGGAGAGGA